VAADSRVGSMLVVVMAPRQVGRGAGVAAEVGGGVGPFGREGTVTSTIRDAAPLPDAHMHQLPRPGLVGANRSGVPHGQPRGPVEVLRQRHRLPVEHPAHGRTRRAEVVVGGARSPHASEPQRRDAPLESLGYRCDDRHGRGDRSVNGVHAHVRESHVAAVGGEH